MNIMKKKILINCLIIISSLCLGLGIAELITRSYFPQQLAVWYQLKDGLVIHPPQFNLYLKKFNTYAQFNSYGMRGRNYTLNKNNDVFRVLLLGDSYMEALQVDYEDSFTNLFELALENNLKKNVEVINAAVSGWGTAEQLYYLKHYGYKFKPDLVLIAMTLHNDIFDNLRENYYYIDNKILKEKQIDEIPTLEYYLLHWKGYLASHLHIVQLYRKIKHKSLIRTSGNKLDRHLLDLISKDNSKELVYGIELTKQLIYSLDRYNNEILHANTAIVLIPLSIQLYNNKLTNFLNTYNYTLTDIQITKSQENLKSIGDELNIHIIDLLPPMKSWINTTKQNIIVPNDGHWNEKGHKIAANHVVKELIKQDINFHNKNK